MSWLTDRTGTLAGEDIRGSERILAKLRHPHLAEVISTDLVRQKKVRVRSAIDNHMKATAFMHPLCVRISLLYQHCLHGQEKIDCNTAIDSIAIHFSALRGRSRSRSVPDGNHGLPQATAFTGLGGANRIAVRRPWLLGLFTLPSITSLSRSGIAGRATGLLAFAFPRTRQPCTRGEPVRLHAARLSFCTRV